MPRKTQKQWTKNMVIARLRDIDQPLDDLDKFGDDGGRMPANIRRQLKTTLKKIHELQDTIAKWTIV